MILKSIMLQISKVVKWSDEIRLLSLEIFLYSVAD